MDHQTVTSPAQSPGNFCTVGEIMTAAVRTLTPDRPIADAVAIFNEYGCRHMPVVSDNRLVGVLSDRDALRAMAQGKGTAVDVGSIMTRGGITVTTKTAITDAIELVVFHRINCLPVADNGTLRGLVTTTDLLQALHQLLQERRGPRP